MYDEKLCEILEEYKIIKWYKKRIIEQFQTKMNKYREGIEKVYFW